MGVGVVSGMHRGRANFVKYVDTADGMQVNGPKVERVTSCGCLVERVTSCGCVVERVTSCGCLMERVTSCGCVVERVTSCGCLMERVTSCGCLMERVTSCGCLLWTMAVEDRTEQEVLMGLGSGGSVFGKCREVFPLRAHS